MQNSDVLLKRKLYLTEFFGESFAVYALIPLFFQQYGQVSVADVGLLLGIWQLSTVIFEIPTGIIADTYGRRASIQLGKLVNTIALIAWLIRPSFLGLLIGVILFSIGNALLSGSIEAYTYDELKNKSFYNKMRQQTVAIHLAAFSFGGLIAYVLEADYRNILIASLVSSIIGLLFSLSLTKDAVTSNELSTMRLIFKQTSLQIRQHKNIVHAFFATVLATAMLVFFIEQINLFYSDTGIADTTVALLMAIGNVITFGILWLMHRFENWMRRYQISLLLFFFVFLGISMNFKNLWAQILMIFLAVRVVRISYLLTSTDLQHVIASKYRATIGSAASFMGKIVAGLSIIIVGLLAELNGDSRMPIYLFGIAIVIVFIIFHKYSLRATHVENHSTT